MVERGVAVVTGGSSGIGKAACALFLAGGFTVYEISRHGKDEDGVSHVTADITDEKSVTDAFSTIFNREKRIDVLVNNAGMGISGAVEFTELSAAKKIFDVNFFGALNCIKAALPYLRESKNAHIVNLSSVAAPVAIPFQSFYSATKAAINSLTLALRNEVKPFGIKVSAVMPGDAKTGFTDAREKSAAGAELYGEAIARAVESMEKDERNGMSPEQVAKVVYKAATAKNPKPLYTAGGVYKLFVFLTKILPTRLFNWIVGKIYG